MTDLVPQSALDAALKRAEAETHAPNYSCFMPSELYASKLLAAAAPHIIEAARPAIEAAFREKWAGPNRDKCQWWCEQYVQCQCGAVDDELEENN